MPENEQIVAENTERDAVVAAPVKADLSKLSSDPWLQANVNTLETKAVDPIEPATPVEEIKPDPNVDLKIEGEVAPNTEAEIKPDAPLTIEETPLTLDEPTEVISDENSWIAYAKEQGLEISEDSPEAYIAAKIEPLQKQLAEVENKKMEDYFHDLDPNIRMEIELNKAGMSLEDIKAPLENIAKYKAMNDAELYREDLTLRYPNATAEWIDADVEKAVENGQVAHDAIRIRLDLDNTEAGIIQERQQIVEKYKINNAKYLEEKRNNEVESISKALNEIPSFMGSTIAPESKQAMARKFSEGKYDQILKDPQFISNALLFHELGTKAYEAAIAKSKIQGTRVITDKLSNIPPVQNVGGKITTEQEQLTGLARLRNEPGLKT